MFKPILQAILLVISFGLHNKYRPGEKYNPAAFADQVDYDAAIDRLQNELGKKIQDQ